jgi:hypothetical protein
VTSVENEVPTYGGFHRPKGFGVGPFGPIGTMLLTGLAFLVMLLVPLAGVVTAIAVGLIGGLTLLSLVWRDRWNQSPLDRLSTKLGYRNAKKIGATEYRPGVLTHFGAHKLPGVLADSHLHEWKDKSGAVFTILAYPGDKLFVVNIGAEPDGALMVDPEDLTAQVDKYGEWMSSLAFESTDLIQAAVCLETGQDSGASLKLEMDNNGAENASWLSKKWARDVKTHYPQGTSAVRAYITLTFKAPPPQVDMAGNKIKGQSALEAIGRLVADRLPHLLEDLPETGAGEVAALTLDELIKTVRCAYNPEQQAIYDECAAKGLPDPVTLWDNVGPSATSAHWDHYVHSGGASITWETSGFVSRRVVAKVLMPVLEPTPKVTKRMTFLYKMIDPALAGAIAESDHRAAEGRITNAKKPTARQHRTAHEANVVRSNEANGSALMNFAILLTATVLDIEDLPQARATVDHQGPTARLMLRLMYGVQDSAFAQALGPLGLVTEKHLNIPTALTNGI